MTLQRLVGYVLLGILAVFCSCGLFVCGLGIMASNDEEFQAMKNGRNEIQSEPIRIAKVSDTELNICVDTLYRVDPTLSKSAYRSSFQRIHSKFPRSSYNTIAEKTLNAQHACSEGFGKNRLLGEILLFLEEAGNDNFLRSKVQKIPRDPVHYLLEFYVRDGCRRD